MKQKLYNHCLSVIDKKIGEITKALDLVTEAANNETKSSAGDKHETARAMMQLEQEKLGRQIKELSDQKTELEKITITSSSSAVIKGSLIKTDKGYLFIAIGLGKIKVDDGIIITISSGSPLAKKLMGSIVNEEVEVNGIRYRIEEIL